MFIVLGKFQLFIYVCNGFWFLFADCAKAFIVLTCEKSCCQPCFLFRKAKDVVAYLTIGLKGYMIPLFLAACRVEF